jgi:hypothetical protein
MTACTQKETNLSGNGIKECWGEPGVDWCDCDATYENGKNAVLGERYTFNSGDCVYIYENGWRKGSTINELLISCNDEEILSEEISLTY